MHSLLSSRMSNRLITSNFRNFSSKIVANATEAVKDVKDGDMLMVGGFGLCGIPENLIDALIEKGTKNHTVVSNNAGIEDCGLGKML